MESSIQFLVLLRSQHNIHSYICNKKHSLPSYKPLYPKNPGKPEIVLNGKKDKSTGVKHR